MTDEELRRRFAELRKRDEANAPDFQRVWNARRASRSRWHVVVPITTLATAAMFVLWCGARTMFDAAPASSTVSRGGETIDLDPAPLDFLLALPESRARSVTLSGPGSNPLEGW